MGSDTTAGGDDTKFISGHLPFYGPGRQGDLSRMLQRQRDRSCSASDRSRQRFTVNEIKTTLSVWSSILGHNFSCNVGPKVTASAAMFRAPKITYEP